MLWRRTGVANAAFDHCMLIWPLLAHFGSREVVPVPADRNYLVLDWRRRCGSRLACGERTRGIAE